MELNLARDFGHDGMRMRVPVGDHFAGRDLVAVTAHHDRAIGNLVTLPFAAMFVDDRQFTRARNRDQLPVGVFHRLEVVEPDLAR